MTISIISIIIALVKKRGNADERQESSQNVADIDFNVENEKPRELAKYCGVCFQRRNKTNTTFCKLSGAPPRSSSPGAREFC